jgi:hypothetical protein
MALMPSTIGINLLTPLSQKETTCCKGIHEKGNISNDNISLGGDTIQTNA